MDEEAGYGIGMNSDGLRERGAHSRQEPLMVFLAAAMDLEAALVTLKEALREFDDLMCGEQRAAAQKSSENTTGAYAVCRRLAGLWKGMLALCGAQHREEEARTGERVNEKALAKEQPPDWMIKKAALCSMVTDMQAEVQLALGRLYAGSGFPEKYQTLPALACLYDYLLSGRCNTLSGGAGAYSVFEAEVRSGAAAAQADEVWARRKEIGKDHPLLVQRLEQARQAARCIALEAAKAGEDEDSARLPAWSAFVQELRQTVESSKND